MADPDARPDDLGPNREPGDPVETLAPIVEDGEFPQRSRRRLSLKAEILLAALPTGIVLIMLGFVEAITQQRVLFASLASSALAIYLDPTHRSNAIRTLLLSHLTAAVIGLATFEVFGHNYAAAGSSMALTILALVSFDIVHPPAVSTSLTFAFREGEERAWVLFLLALAVTAALVALERLTLWVLARVDPRNLTRTETR